MLEVIAKTLGRLIMSGLTLMAWHAYNRYAGSSTGEHDAFSAMEYAAAVLLVWSAYPVLVRVAGPDDDSLHRQAALAQSTLEDFKTPAAQPAQLLPDSPSAGQSRM